MTPEEKAVIEAAMQGWDGQTLTDVNMSEMSRAVEALIFACPQCNAGGHVCPGDGSSIGHTQTACASCNEELDADVRESQRVAAIYERPVPTTGYPCGECLIDPAEDPAPWCDCLTDEQCPGPCRRRAHSPHRCPNLPAPEWVPATLLFCLAGDHIRMGADETDVTRSSAGIWHADTSNAWQPKAWRHTELRMDLTANPGFQQYPPNLECEILCTPERKATLLLQQAFPGSVIVSSDVD